MEKDGACKMYRQNKKCCYAITCGRRKNNARTDKEEGKKLAGPLVKKKLPDEECSRSNGMYVKYSARRQVRPSTCTTRVVDYISPFTRQKKGVR